MSCNWDPRGEVYCSVCHMPEDKCKCSELQRLRRQVAMLKKQLAAASNEAVYQRNLNETLSPDGKWDYTKY